MLLASQIAAMTLDALGVDSTIALQIQSCLMFAGGAVLTFIPGMQGLGWSLMTAGLGGPIGGAISHSLGGNYATGWGIGTAVGGVLGGGIGRLVSRPVGPNFGGGTLRAL